MVSGINPYYSQQMAASANYGGSYVGGEQQQYPSNDNKLSIDGNNSVNGSSNVTSGNYKGGVNATGGTGANIDLVSRLDQIGAKDLTPKYQEGEHVLDFYS